MPTPPSGLDGNIVALVSVFALFFSSVLGALLLRVGAKKSEDNKEIDQIIGGLKDDVERKRKDIERLDREVAELKAENRQLAAVDRDAFLSVLTRLFPESIEPNELPPPEG